MPVKGFIERPWLKKPRGIPRINNANPIAAKLTNLLWCGEGRYPIDLVTGAIATEGGGGNYALPVVGPHGTAHRLPAVQTTRTDSLNVPITAFSAGADTARCSFVAVSSIPDATVEDSGGVTVGGILAGNNFHGLNVGYNDFSAVKFSIRVRDNAQNDSVSFYFGTGGETRILPMDEICHNNIVVSGATVRGASDTQCFVNQHTNNTTVTLNITGDWVPSQLKLGGVFSPDDGITECDCYYLAVFKPLTDEEHFELARNPWCIFEPELIPLSIAGGVGGVTLTVAGALQSLAADQPSLSQAQTLIVAEALHALTAANVALTQGYNLTVAGALQSVLADQIALSVSSSLAINDALQAMTADNVQLTQAHALVIAEALLAVSAEDLTLSVAGALDVAEALQAMTADNVQLTQAHALVIAEALLAVSAEDLTLSVAGALDVAEALQAVTADSVVLTQANVLQVAETLQQIAADEIALAPASTLTVGDTIQAISVDEIELSQGLVLAVDEALLSMSAELVGLTQGHVLAIADATLAMLAANIDLTQSSTLIIDDALHALLVDSITLGEPPTSKATYIVVSSRERRVIVARRNRRIEINH